MGKRFPEWLRRPWASDDALSFTKDGVVDAHGLHTVCQSAQCPNLGECWARGTATVMILGNVCTRGCRFCSVPSGLPGGLVEVDEPERVAEAVAGMKLKHCVITMVTRDDLSDGGAAVVAETVRAIRARTPGTTVELLTSDFNNDRMAIDAVLEAGPDVFGHNLEVVERLSPTVRDTRFTYGQTLDVLRYVADSNCDTVVKSAFMLGLGERPEEVRQTLTDLREAGVEAVAVGQYLQPTPKHHAVTEYVHPDVFAEYEAYAYEIGFVHAVAGPFVRSSYRSDEILEASLTRRRAAQGRV